MQEESSAQELKDRLSLIESMVAEGRRTTEKFSWIFVLWGVAYYLAILWSTGAFIGPIWGSNYLAWPVTMIAASVLTWALIERKSGKEPSTTSGRAIFSIWMSMGLSMFILLPSLVLSGRGDQQTAVALVATMLGTTNAASGMLLKWKQQFACALVWWAAAVASLFGTVTQSTIAFLVAIFLCQIVFGIYGMICEARIRKQRGAIHA